MITGIRPSLVASVAMAILSLGAAPAGLLSHWTFDGEKPGANAVAGAPEGRIENASQVEGHNGKALAFEDWSVKDYLKPDPRKATRLSVPHDAAQNPAFPFTVSAWIYATADPLFYGGIVEKGTGFGGSWGLLLLRGLKPQAVIGDRHAVARASDPISLNSWHEIAMKSDGRTLALFVDGKEVARVEIPTGTKLASTAPLVIGERFTGRIDDVSIEAR